MSQGSIRFNTSDNLFSGQTTARVTFGGVYSADRSSFARAEPLSNTINFSINSATVMAATATGISVVGLTVDNITVNNNIISTNNINLVLDPDASNTVDVDDFRFDDNLITNLSNNPMTLSTTGTGYVKFVSTSGMRIPAGTNAERPGGAAEGTTRWNTEEDYLEIFINGTWQIATASGSGFATLAEIGELGDLWTLILG
jgi:hypothetical protein